MINILEEGTTELVALKTKKFLNENLSIIHKILVEEGVVDGARNHLANNWGKYAAGAALGGAALGAATVNGADGTDAIDTFNNGTGNIKDNTVDALKAAGQNIKYNAGVAGDVIDTQYDAAKHGFNFYNQARDTMNAPEAAVQMVSGELDGLSPAEKDAMIAGSGAFGGSFGGSLNGSTAGALGGGALGAGAMYAATRNQQK